jgi:hypothetical protein
MKEHWGVEVHFHAFLTSALDGGEWSASRADRFTPRKETLVPNVGSRASLDAVVKRKIPTIRKITISSFGSNTLRSTLARESRCVSVEQERRVFCLHIVI